MIIFGNDFFSKLLYLNSLLKSFAKYFLKKDFCAQWTINVQQIHINNQDIRQKLKFHKNKKHKIKTQDSKNQQRPKTQLKTRNFL
jgi:hypothetical protein